jgi:hypothetical protein
VVVVWYLTGHAGSAECLVDLKAPWHYGRVEAIPQQYRRRKRRRRLSLLSRKRWSRLFLLRRKRRFSRLSLLRRKRRRRLSLGGGCLYLEGRGGGGCLYWGGRGGGGGGGGGSLYSRRKRLSLLRRKRRRRLSLLRRKRRKRRLSLLVIRSQRRIRPTRVRLNTDPKLCAQTTVRWVRSFLTCLIYKDTTVSPVASLFDSLYFKDFRA